MKWPAATEPLLVVLEHVNHQIGRADRELARRVTEDPKLRRLTTLPGVGPVTATTFKATIDEVARFRRAGHGHARRSVSKDLAE